MRNKPGHAKTIRAAAEEKCKTMNKTNESPELREFTYEDSLKCCLLIERCVQDYQGICEDAYEKFRKRTKEQKFNDYVNRNCRFVAVIGNKIIGMGGTEDDMVKLMYVDPDFRFIGIGRRIHDMLVNYQQSKGFKEITIDSSINAVPFYLKLGYREIERTKFYLTGSEINQCIMKKFIGSEHGNRNPE